MKHLPKIPQNLHQSVADKYQAGMTLCDIAVEIGSSVYHVQSVLKAMGGPLRTYADYTRKIIDPDLLQQLTDRHLTVAEIAQHFGVSKPVIERALRRHGIRSKKGRGSKLHTNYFWKGGISKDSDGYVLIKSPDHPHRNRSGYVREHRLVAEKMLGRFLEKTEVVHHRDGDRSNNDPSNLQVFASNAEHLRFELTGKTPNHTPGGLQRMRESAIQTNRRRYASSRSVSENGDSE